MKEWSMAFLIAFHVSLDENGVPSSLPARRTELKIVTDLTRFGLAQDESLKSSDSTKDCSSHLLYVVTPPGVAC